MINQRINNYTILRKIGEGGMATVYLAEHSLLGTQVALKVLNQDFVRNQNIRNRFLAEARNIAKMQHKQIIRVSDLIDAGDFVAFAMEYIDGQTLKEYLEKKGKLNDAEIQSLLVQMLDAVGYVHNNRLIHRDIKPSNFMVDKDGVLKLLDFGIAKNMDASAADYTSTGTTQQMGTIMYMSPEQVKSTKDVTPATDIYSLGVVLWQMVKGSSPYNPSTSGSFEIQSMIVHEPLPLTHTKWDSFIQKATAKEEGERFGSCKEWMEKVFVKEMQVEVPTENLRTRTNSLYHKIKRSSKSDILNNVKSFEKEIESLEKDINSLPEGTEKSSILRHDYYRYLVSHEWIPKKRPIGFVVAICLLVAGVCYGIFYGFSPASDKQANANADNDHDGIPNSADAEPNTLWLADASKYKLKDYIRGDGTLDRNKVDQLCNCFEIADPSERAKINCTDNAEYFVFEGKLWHYDAAKNGFFDKDNLYVTNDAKTPICLHYKDLIAESKTVMPEPTVPISNDCVTISYKSKKYSVPKNLTSANGLVINGADYRFYNKKWETRAMSGSGTWKTPNETDINFVLLKVGKVIAPKITDPEGGKQSGTEPTNEVPKSVELKGNAGDNAADKFYRSYFSGQNPRTENAMWVNIKRDKEIIKSYNEVRNITPSTVGGKKAEKIIKDYLKDKY